MLAPIYHLLPLIAAALTGPAPAAAYSPIEPPPPNAPSDAHVPASPTTSTPTSTAPMAQDPTPARIESTSGTLIELFTSEGCSSCPPAERVAAELARTPGAIVVVYHIDYWDSLGWPDRFASAAFTQRQTEYRDALKVRSLYTPQMIIGGTAEFIGSDRERAQRELKSVPVFKPLQLSFTNVTVEKIPVKDEQTMPGATALPLQTVTVSCDITPAPTTNAKFRVVVVEDGLSSNVTRGENAGKVLAHGRTARAAGVGPANEHSSITLDLPASANLASARLVAFVQDETTMRVLGAIEAPLPIAAP